MRNGIFFVCANGHPTRRLYYASPEHGWQLFKFKAEGVQREGGKRRGVPQYGETYNLVCHKCGRRPSVKKWNFEAWCQKLFEAGWTAVDIRHFDRQ